MFRSIPLLLFLAYANGANILCLMGIPSPSHHIFNRALMEAVAQNGKNNLTIVSCDVERQAPPNMHYIHLETIYSYIYNDSSEPFDLIAMAKGGAIAELVDYYKFGLLSTEGMFKSNGLAQILRYPKSFKFDLVLHDFTMGPGLLGILNHFDHQPPVVSVTGFSIPPFTSAVIGGHKYPAYIPYYSLTFTTSMNFWQRCQNLFMYIADAM
jgi:glucuronosyltransferase